MGINWKLHNSSVFTFINERDLKYVPTQFISEMNDPNAKYVTAEISGNNPEGVLVYPMQHIYDSVPDWLIGIGTNAYHRYTVWGLDEFDYFPDSNIENIYISEGIKYLANAAFPNEALKNIRLPSTLLFIGNNCFEQTELSSIEIPDTVQYIGSSCFVNCMRLKTCKLPSNLSQVNARTFLRCYSLEAIYIPGKVASIGEEAFAESGLRTLSFCEGIYSIASNAFRECESLFNVALPRSLSNIADDAFDPPEKNPLLTFYVYPGSYGLIWAREHGYPVRSAEV